MKTKHVWTLLLAVAALCAASAVQLSAANEKEAKKEAQDDKGVALITSKIEESEAKSKMDDPQFGYIGLLGTFEAAKKTPSGEAPIAAFVVHQYPEQAKQALGRTKLKYMGMKRLGNVDGWIFQTEWDGKEYPSKVFLSAERVYFGGGISAFIAADYRNDTGWVWKYHPLRRMELLKKSESGAEDR